MAFLHCGGGGGCSAPGDGIVFGVPRRFFNLFSSGRKAGRRGGEEIMIRESKNNALGEGRDAGEVKLAI